MRGHEPNSRQDRQTLARRRAPAGQQNAGHELVVGGPFGDFALRVRNAVAGNYHP